MDTTSPPTPAVSVENLVKRYGSFVAVDHLSLSIRPGEVFGLLGPNGRSEEHTSELQSPR